MADEQNVLLPFDLGDIDNKEVLSIKQAGEIAREFTNGRISMPVIYTWIAQIQSPLAVQEFLTTSLLGISPKCLNNKALFNKFVSNLHVISVQTPGLDNPTWLYDEVRKLLDSEDDALRELGKAYIRNFATVVMLRMGMPDLEEGLFTPKRAAQYIANITFKIAVKNRQVTNHINDVTYWAAEREILDEDLIEFLTAKDTLYDQMDLDGLKAELDIVCGYILEAGVGKINKTLELIITSYSKSIETIEELCIPGEDGNIIQYDNVIDFVERLREFRRMIRQHY